MKVIPETCTNLDIYVFISLLSLGSMTVRTKIITCT